MRLKDFYISFNRINLMREIDENQFPFVFLIQLNAFTKASSIVTDHLCGQ